MTCKRTPKSGYRSPQNRKVVPENSRILIPVQFLPLGGISPLVMDEIDKAVAEFEELQAKRGMKSPADAVLPKESHSVELT